MTVILKAFGLEGARAVSAGGTAGGAWRVATSRGDFFLRGRGPRTSGESRIHFDHALRTHLAEKGFCAYPPIPADNGQSSLSVNGSIYELYPWIEGRSYGPDIQELVRAEAAVTLARLHLLAHDFDGDCEKALPQFAHFPVPIAEFDRFDHPDALAGAVGFIVENYGTLSRRRELRKAFERVERLRDSYLDLYRILPERVIHGDYNACNLLFTPAGTVVGVFDFDWAWRDTRVRDVAEGALFFGARRTRRIDSGNIWELTACPQLNTGTMQEFIRAYHTVNPLTPDEIRAIIPALLGCWTAFRAEGVMKVPEKDRAEFFLRDFLRPFEWADEATLGIQNGAIIE